MSNDDNLLIKPENCEQNAVLISSTIYSSGNNLIYDLIGGQREHKGIVKLNHRN